MAQAKLALDYINLVLLKSEKETSLNCKAERDFPSKLRSIEKML